MPGNRLIIQRNPKNTGFSKRETSRSCLVCDRPAVPYATVCVYCGEDIPLPPWLRRLRLILPSLALAGTIAFALLRAPYHILAAHLLPPWPLPNALLIALGVGLVLLPPSLSGVAAADRRERLRPVASRFLGGLLLAGLVALAGATAGTPQSWSGTQRALALVIIPTLAALPALFGIPWSALVAGLLLAVAGLV